MRSSRERHLPTRRRQRSWSSILLAAGSLALLNGSACSSDECLAVGFQPSPVRLKLTDANGDDICTAGVIATPSLPEADAGEDADVRPLEVVTYEKLCEHRVFGGFVEGEALSVVVAWESEDGEAFRSDVVQLPFERDQCDEIAGGVLSLRLERVPEIRR